MVSTSSVGIVLGAGEPISDTLLPAVYEICVGDTLRSMHASPGEPSFPRSFRTGIRWFGSTCRRAPHSQLCAMLPLWLFVIFKATTTTGILQTTSSRCLRGSAALCFRELLQCFIHKMAKDKMFRTTAPKHPLRLFPVATVPNKLGIEAGAHRRQLIVLGTGGSGRYPGTTLRPVPVSYW